MIVFRKTPIIRASTLDVSLSLSLNARREEKGKKGDRAPPSAKWTAFEISARIIGSIGWLHTGKNGARVGLIAD